MRPVRRIKVTPAAFFMLSAMLFSLRSRRIALLAAAIAVHEAGHIAAMHITGAGVARLVFRVGGLELIPKRAARTYAEQTAVALGGVIFNAALWLFTFRAGGTWRELANISLAYAALNALPITGLDGGSAFSILTEATLPYETARAARQAVNGAFLLLLFVLAIYLLWVFPDNPSFFVMCAGLYLYGLRASK